MIQTLALEKTLNYLIDLENKPSCICIWQAIHLDTSEALNSWTWFIGREHIVYLVLSHKAVSCVMMPMFISLQGYVLLASF